MALKKQTIEEMGKMTGAQASTTPVIFADLDDTLFQTRRKCPEGIPESDLVRASWLENGETSGYTTPIQRAMFGWLNACEVIPVTARSRDVIARTTVAQGRRAVCSNGGVILNPDGTRDEDWRRRMRMLSERGVTVEKLYAAVTGTGLLDDHYRHWIVSDDDFGLYVVIKHNDLTDEHLEATAREIADREVPRDWTVHVNGNNVAFIPPWLGKLAAVEHIISQLRANGAAIPMVGMGDSLTDLPFMTACDYALIPTRSQITRLLLRTHSA